MFLDGRQAVEVLRAGKPLIFPTDTVVGVGVATAYAPDASSLAQLKGRAPDKPVAWLVPAPDALDIYGEGTPVYAHRLVEAFWPGALTVIVSAAPSVPAAFASPEGTIGLRMPASPIPRELMALVASPLAATSANFAGETAPRTYEQLDPAFTQRVGAVLQEAPASQQRSALLTEATSALRHSSAVAASTVIDCTREEPCILRAGAIPSSDIMNVLREP